jgi:hypothetical protein
VDEKDKSRQISQQLVLPYLRYKRTVRVRSFHELPLVVREGDWPGLRVATVPPPKFGVPR